MPETLRQSRSSHGRRSPVKRSRAKRSSKNIVDDASVDTADLTVDSSSSTSNASIDTTSTPLLQSCGCAVTEGDEFPEERSSPKRKEKKNYDNAIIHRVSPTDFDTSSFGEKRSGTIPKKIYEYTNGRFRCYDGCNDTDFDEVTVQDFMLQFSVLDLCSLACTKCGNKVGDTALDAADVAEEVGRDMVCFVFDCATSSAWTVKKSAEMTAREVTDNAIKVGTFAQRKSDAAGQFAHEKAKAVGNFAHERAEAVGQYAHETSEAVSNFAEKTAEDVSLSCHRTVTSRGKRQVAVTPSHPSAFKRSQRIIKRIPWHKNKYEKPDPELYFELTGTHLKPMLDGDEEPQLQGDGCFAIVTCGACSGRGASAEEQDIFPLEFEGEMKQEEQEFSFKYQNEIQALISESLEYSEDAVQELTETKPDSTCLTTNASADEAQVLSSAASTSSISVKTEAMSASGHDGAVAESQTERTGLETDIGVDEAQILSSDASTSSKSAKTEVSSTSVHNDEATISKSGDETSTGGAASVSSKVETQALLLDCPSDTKEEVTKSTSQENSNILEGALEVPDAALEETAESPVAEDKGQESMMTTPSSGESIKSGTLSYVAPTPEVEMIAEGEFALEMVMTTEESVQDQSVSNPAESGETPVLANTSYSDSLSDVFSGILGITAKSTDSGSTEAISVAKTTSEAEIVENKSELSKRSAAEATILENKSELSKKSSVEENIPDDRENTSEIAVRNSQEETQREESTACEGTQDMHVGETIAQGVATRDDGNSGEGRIECNNNVIVKESMEEVSAVSSSTKKSAEKSKKWSRISKTKPKNHNETRASSSTNKKHMRSKATTSEAEKKQKKKFSIRRLVSKRSAKE